MNIAVYTLLAFAFGCLVGGGMVLLGLDIPETK